MHGTVRVFMDDALLRSRLNYVNMCAYVVVVIIILGIYIYIVQLNYLAMYKFSYAE